MSDEQITAAAERLIDHAVCGRGCAYKAADRSKSDTLAVARFTREAAARIAEQDREIERWKHDAQRLALALGQHRSDMHRESSRPCPTCRFSKAVLDEHLALAASTVAPEGRGKEAVDDAPR